ncbi:MAG: zinc-ribbon and DUF3426 domain-containing protein [Gammaproteobacteria bacterium]
MFTRCPDCQKIQALTVEQLRVGRGMLRCGRCSSMFDALLYLSETDEVDTTASDPISPVFWAKSKRPNRLPWRLGLVSGVAVLIAQYVYFEGHALTQKPGFRVWAERLCGQIDCALPVYRNIDEFEVLHRSLTQSPDQNYEFKVVFSNQAAFRQPYPNIHLTLLNFAGQPFAHRVLVPGEYLAGVSTADLIEADATAEISLRIAAPATKIGGFDFAFTF